ETALLKTLEEPPDHTRFILMVRSLDEIKPTVVSRGICVPFGLLPASEMEALASFAPAERELMGGSMHLAPFLATNLCSALKLHINRMFDHPQGLLDTETWLLAAEKKGPPEAAEDEDKFDFNSLIDFFGLFLLQRAEDHPQGAIL